MSDITANVSTFDATAQKRVDWSTISIIGIAHGTSHFFHLIVAPLFPFLKVHFGLSYSQLGLLMTAFFVVSGIGQALAGFIVDKLGARPVLFFGFVCFIAAALGLSISTSYAMLMAFSALAGLGNSVFHPVDFSILNHRVSQPRLGYAYSVHGLSGTLGWALAPLFLVPIAKAYGWQTALQCAAVLAAVVLAFLVTVREKISDQHVMQHLAQSKAAAIAAPKQESVLSFMGLPVIWMCWGFFFLSTMALGGVQSFAATTLRTLYGMSDWAAGNAITVFMVASAAGMLVGGGYASKVKRLDLLLACTMSVSACSALLLSTGAWPAAFAFVLFALMGFGNGFGGPSRDMLIKSATPKGATGRVYGVVYSGLDVGLSLSPYLFGAMLDGGRYSAVFIGIAIFQFCAIATAWQVRARVVQTQAAPA